MREARPRRPSSSLIRCVCARRERKSFKSPFFIHTHTLHTQRWLVHADAVLAKLAPRTYAKCQAEQKIKKGDKDYSKTVMKSTCSVYG
jgi:hypothetical protein